MKRNLFSLALVAMSLTAFAGCVADTEPTDEASQEIVKPCSSGLVTRTQGFWKNHTCVLAGQATGFALLPVRLGAGTVFDKPEDVTNFLSTAPKGGNTQLILGHQLLAAKLNVKAFDIGSIAFADWDGDGHKETVSQLLQIADGLYDSGSSADRTKMANILDKLNNAGDAAATWFDVTCHTPPPHCG